MLIQTFMSRQASHTHDATNVTLTRAKTQHSQNLLDSSTDTLRCASQKKYIHSEDIFFLPSRIRYDGKPMRFELTKHLRVRPTMN